MKLAALKRRAAKVIAALAARRARPPVILRLPRNGRDIDRDIDRVPNDGSVVIQLFDADRLDAAPAGA